MRKEGKIEMKKYIVNIGGYVSTYREEEIIVEADDCLKAGNKAKALFMIHQEEEQAGNMCDEAVLNEIREVK